MLSLSAGLLSPRSPSGSVLALSLSPLSFSLHERYFSRCLCLPHPLHPISGQTARPALVETTRAVPALPLIGREAHPAIYLRKKSGDAAAGRIIWRRGRQMKGARSVEQRWRAARRPGGQT